ncbi:hypothetical protein AC249_AIPGENE21905 [Exaiptasia diaphana]|nr:hypothetical protein AC249_AIPGENE21905 [Exaiptasia diaphana]
METELYRIISDYLKNHRERLATKDADNIFVVDRKANISELPEVSLHYVRLFTRELLRQYERKPRVCFETLSEARGVQEVPFARDGQYPLALSKAGLDFRQVEFLLEVGAQRQQQHVFLAQEDEMDRIPNLIIPYGWADFRRRQHPPHPNPVPQHNVQPG